MIELAKIAINGLIDIIKFIFNRKGMALDEIKKTLSEKELKEKEREKRVDTFMDVTQKSLQDFSQTLYKIVTKIEEQVSTSEQLMQKVGEIKEYLENNMYTELFNEMTKVIEVLEVDDTNDKIIIRYFNEKLNIVLMHYTRFKDSFKANENIDLLNNELFVSSLLGDARSELKALCEGFPEDFLDFCVDQNKKDYESFVKNILFAASSKDSNLLEMIRVNTTKSFVNNIKKIVNKYIDIKDKITCNGCNTCTKQ